MESRRLKNIIILILALLNLCLLGSLAIRINAEHASGTVGGSVFRRRRITGCQAHLR